MGSIRAGAYTLAVRRDGSSLPFLLRSDAAELRMDEWERRVNLRWANIMDGHLLATASRRTLNSSEMKAGVTPLCTAQGLRCTAYFINMSPPA